MTKETGASQTVHATLSERLSALTPDQLVSPSKQKVDESITVAGEANEHTKRVFVVYGNLFDEINTLATRRNELEDQIDDAIAKGDTFLGSLKALITGGLAQSVVDEATLIDAQLPALKDLEKIAKTLFWAEVFAQFPDLRNKAGTVVVCDDWSIGWMEKSSSIFRILGGDTLPPGLEAAITESFEALFGARKAA